MVASLTTKVDSTTTNNTIYIGTANSADSDTSKPVWSIKRVTISGDDLDIEWADGAKTPNQKWTDRATLTYK